MGLDSGSTELGLIYGELTEGIIGCFYRVYNALGYGFLEKVYENSLAIELRKRGYLVKQQASVMVYYEEEIVGDYFADIIVEEEVRGKEGIQNC